MAMTTPSHSLVPVSPPQSDRARQAEAELTRIEALLVEAELRLVTLRQQLAVFGRQYRLVAAGLCEQLEQLNARIAAMCADRIARHSRRGRSRARRNRPADEQTPGNLPELLDFVPSESLQKLYRAAAKRFHPDLAEDDADRVWRTQMMQQANAAYAAGDCERLRNLLERDSARKHGVAVIDTTLAALLEKTARVRARLDEAFREAKEIEASDLGQLFAQAKGCGDGPAAFLRDLAVTLKAEIHEKQKLLEDLLAEEPRDER